MNKYLIAIFVLISIVYSSNLYAQSQGFDGDYIFDNVGENQRDKFLDDVSSCGEDVESESNFSDCNVCGKSLSKKAGEGPVGADGERTDLYIWDGIEITNGDSAITMIGINCTGSNGGSILNSASTRAQQANLISGLFNSSSRKGGKKGSTGSVGAQVEFSDDVKGVSTPITFSTKLGGKEIVIPSTIGFGTGDSVTQFTTALQPMVELVGAKSRRHQLKVLVNTPMVFRYTGYDFSEDGIIDGQVGASVVVLENVYLGELSWGFAGVTDVRYTLGAGTEAPLTLATRLEYKGIIAQFALSASLSDEEIGKGASLLGNVGYAFGDWIVGYNTYLNNLFGDEELLVSGHGFGVTYNRSIFDKNKKEKK